MSTSKKETWRRLSDPPTVERRIAYVAKAVALSDTEFISSTRVIPRDKKIKIMKYNSLKNEWTKWSELDSYNGPDHCPFEQHFLSLDADRNKLFMFEGKRKPNYFAIMVRDLTNEKWRKFKRACSCSKGRKVYAAHSTLFVGGVYHLFVASRQPYSSMGPMFTPDSCISKLKHFVLDEDSKKFVKQFEFITDLPFRGEVSLLPIHVSKMDSILLIQEGVLNYGVMWRFELNAYANQWSAVQGVSLPRRIKMATLTSDEQCIVMADSDNIFLMDISDENDFKLFKSDISIPIHSKVKYSCSSNVGSLIRMVSRVMDEKLVVGWTKRLFKEGAFQELSLPPLYLLQMIAVWVLNEEIHYLPRQYDINGSEMHFVISMTRILASKLTKI